MAAFGGEHERGDVFVVPVDVVMMMVVILDIGLGGEPFLHVGDFARGIVQPAVHQPFGGRFAFRRIEDRRRRIERAQAREDGRALFGAGQIGFGQHDAVGHRRLLDRFGMRVERRLAIDAVDHGDDAVEPVALHQIRMRHGGVQQRRRIGQAGRFDQHAAEGAAPVVEIAQQRLQRVHQIAAHGAAQATRLQQHHVVADIFDQQVIERDVAEFVDDDGGIAQRRVLEQAVEQRGLAGAEKAGEHGERNGLGRPAPIGAIAGSRH